MSFIKKYSIDMVKSLFNKAEYRELVKIVDEIRILSVYDKEDIEILNYLFKNKDVDTYLYESMITTYEEFKIKFMNEEKQQDSSIAHETEEILHKETFDDDLKKILFDKNIEVLEYKLVNEESPKISFKVSEQVFPYLYNIMNFIYKSKVADIGFEMTYLKSVEYDVFSVYLLPSVMLDDVIEQQVSEIKKIIINSVMSTNIQIDYKYDTPQELIEFINYFENFKTVYYDESYKVSYIRNNNENKFYLATSTKEELLNFKDKKEQGYKGTSKIISFDNKPYVSSKKAAYVTNKTIGFVIFLTILVVICVSILTLKG